MPFDGIPVNSTKVRLLALGPDLFAFGPTPAGGEAAAPRAIPAWHSCRRPESLSDTLAVLGCCRTSGVGAADHSLGDGEVYRCRQARPWRGGTAPLAPSGEPVVNSRFPLKTPP